MAEADPHELADQLQREADDLERHAQEVKGEVDETRQDWERKRADASVPGAVPPKGGQGDTPGETDDA